MAARVQVVVEAKDQTSGVFRALTSQLGAFGGVVEELTTKNVNWGNVATMATQMVVDGVKDAMKVTADYTEDVRDLALASGQTAEASSRMLQVLDDYQLTAEDAATATRALTKQGLAPTIETVAQLSSEYLKLNDAEDRNAFLMKNLGRAGKEWMNLLSQGPDAIMQMNSAVADGLILTDENIAAYEKYRLALDEWNDSVMAAKVALGNELIPALTGVVDEVNLTGRAIEIMKEKGMSGLEIFDAMALSTVEYTDALKEASQASEEHSVAMTKEKQTTEELAAAEKLATEQAAAISKEVQQFIGVLGNVGTALTTYQEGLATANAELDAGKIKASEHSAKVAELAASYQEARNQIVLSIVEMKLATDGWTEVELNAYMQVGQKLGVFSQDQINVAKGAVAMADKLIATEQPFLHAGNRAMEAGVMLDSFGDSAEGMTEAAMEAAGGASALKSSLAKLPPSGTGWEYNFTINVHGRVPNMPNHGESNLNAGVGYQSGQQQGGEVYAGVPTRVGEAGWESFMPSRDGRILGHAESLRALAMGGGGGGAKFGPFYGNVTLQISEDGAGGIMGIR